MAAKLYALSLSHPAHAARAMLEHKSIEHRVVNLIPGMHPLLLRGLGFRGGTVPALRIDGRRVQGSLRISRALEELRAEPPLFPSQPELRRRVVDAELWGEQVLQEVPRRLFRWATANQQELRWWIGAKLVGVPAPGLLGRANAPVAKRFARISAATDANVRRDLERLPALLDEADSLLDAQVIGTERPNAADFQIASSIRVLLAFDDLRPLLAERPSADLAQRLVPRYPSGVPARVPTEWVAAAA